MIISGNLKSNSISRPFKPRKTHEWCIAKSDFYFEKIFKSPERTEYVRHIFSKIAPRYDLLNRIMSLGFDIYWRRLAIKSANFESGSRILDLGVGTGDMGREAVRIVKDCQVYGLDNCFELMQYGRLKFKKNGALNSIHWMMGDGRRLPFCDNSLDGVIAAFSIRNMADLPAVFAEIYRITRANGKIVILDMVKPLGFFSNQIFKFHFKYIVPRLGQWLGSDPEAYSYLLPCIENFYSSQKLKTELKNRGYKNVFSQDLMFSTVTICIGSKQ